MKTFYQLIAKGTYALFDEKGRCHSKVIFENKDEITEEVINDFKRIVTTPIAEGDISYMDENGLEIKIAELYCK
jgi:hypothetical protein